MFSLSALFILYLSYGIQINLTEDLALYHKKFYKPTWYMEFVVAISWPICMMYLWARSYSHKED